MFLARWWTHRYLVDTLLIRTTSRATTSTPINVQTHIPPPIHTLLPIHPLAWFIKFLSLRRNDAEQSFQFFLESFAGIRRALEPLTPVTAGYKGAEFDYFDPLGCKLSALILPPGLIRRGAMHAKIRQT